MPTRDAETLLAVPLAVIEPMVLLATATVPPLLDEPMPNVVAPFPEVVTETEPVPVPLPMVLPVTVPTFAEPATNQIPLHMPGTPAVPALVQTMF